MKIKEVDIKKPKYIIPLLALPFVLGIGYLITDMVQSSEKKKNEVTQLAEKQELNIEIPDAELKDRDVKSKFEALKSSFAKSSDFSSIQTIDKEEKFNEVEDGGSLYTTEEMRRIDSLNQASTIKRAELEQQLSRGNNLYDNTEPDRENDRKNPDHAKMQDEMELFKMQMAYIDSIQNPERYKKRNDEVKLAKEEKKEEAIEVIKASNPAINYFNTVGKDEKTSLITAILDENIKVEQGSRVKIRLLDDIKIQNSLLAKGTYIYGNVSGFAEQRVKIKISSIMINGKRIKVDLSVFDNDGQEGFFVPQSSFRDLSKDIGSQLGSQNITMNASDGGIEQFAYNALQDVYRSTSQAISKNIKKNKAKLKYNTQVFLVNNKEKEN